MMKLVNYKYLLLNLNKKKNKRKRKQNKKLEGKKKKRKLKLQWTSQSVKNGLSKIFFTKLQRMKNKQSKIKPIKSQKELGTIHWGIKILRTILEHKK